MAAVSVALGTTPRTVRRWRDRFAAEGGEAGLRDRSSRPHRSPARLSAAAEAEIASLRRRRRSGPAIARQLGRQVSTVGVALRRLGLGRLAALALPGHPLRARAAGRADPYRHQEARPHRWRRPPHHRRPRRPEQQGRPRRGALGSEYFLVAIDDASLLAYTALMPDEKTESAVRFLEDALGWFGAHGVGVKGVMTDNGSAFKSKLFAATLQSSGLRQKRTRPNTPRTNGKAERFIQTSLREWAYAMPFHSLAERARATPAWLCHDNSLRPHSALGGKPPTSRLARDNLLGSDI